LAARILILGGGYAGVTAAVNLRGIQAQVTLINRHNYHYFTNLIHEAAVGRRDKDVSVDLRQLLRPEINFMRGTVQSIAPKERQVQVKVKEGLRTLEYDYLVIALGWEPQFYNIPGLKENALTLTDLNAARLIKGRIEEAIILHENSPSEKWRLEIIIGGGGLAGVELAGELADWRPQLARSFDLDLKEIGITLVEVAPTILPGLDKSLVERATTILEQKGVRCMTGARITKVEPNRVLLGEEHPLEAGTIIWTGGVRGNHLVEQSGFAVNKQGRAYITPYLQARDYPEIYIIGDCSLATDPQGNVLPPTAQIAVQQGVIVAKNLRRALENREQLPYTPRYMGMILSLGRKDALGVIAKRHLSGWVARTLKDLIAYRYLFGIGGPLLVLRKFWEWGPYFSCLRRL